MVAIFLLLMAAFLIWLGYQLAVTKLRADRARLDYQQAALAEEWRRLDHTRRVRAVFLAARRAMRAEADRFIRPPTDDKQRGAS